MSETSASNGASAATDVLTWARDHWRWIAALLLVLLVVWRCSGRRPDENGRYVLVKDDVPCQVQREDDAGRRWCYIVLDTRSGRLEERVRKVGGQKGK